MPKTFLMYGKGKIETQLLGLFVSTYSDIWMNMMIWYMIKTVEHVLLCLIIINITTPSKSHRHP